MGTDDKKAEIKSNLRFRIDFIQEVLGFDEKSGVFKIALIPDPNRYEWHTRDGKRCLYDKLDRILISEEVLIKMAPTLEGSPIYYQPPRIERSEEYVQGRLTEIDKMLTGTLPVATFEDKSEEFLRSLECDKLGFVIISLDIVGSTKLVTELPAEKYKKIVSVALYEFSTVVPKFHGHVLKYTGDGIIAYFPEPSFIIKNDLALDCALTLRHLVYHGLNPSYKKHGLPQIEVRLGLDSGEAYIETIGNPATKQHKDIIGAVVNIATKIQGTASAGSVHLGLVTFQNLHTSWRIQCQNFPLPQNWQYKSQSGEPYAIYRYIG
jgi:hypothetical protein